MDIYREVDVEAEEKWECEVSRKKGGRGRKRRNQDLSGLDKNGERRMAGHGSRDKPKSTKSTSASSVGNRGPRADADADADANAIPSRVESGGGDLRYSPKKKKKGQKDSFFCFQQDRISFFASLLSFCKSWNRSWKY